ncbi:Hydrogen peroxide-inducible genes activator [Streptomonospora litoralis]|uniref:Hydrogen peroxide-inducible genes activator n=1 Tax=Streptomonospora litoralis TaxID=2498135 RepID=A0A4P6PUV2_9ACTN|nr:Hydrogen peroxide-inducible genes activator [Streptomonospora litoralis]
MLDAVAVHGTVAQAAQALHVTPSGVSQHLNKLDRETGHRLLEPDGRGLRLTHAGRVLAEHAATVMAQVGAAESDLADLREETLGPLRIGSVGSAVRTLLPGALAELADAHPRLIPSVRDGEVIDMMPLLLRGELDLLLVESWANRPVFLPAGLAVHPLVDEEVRAAVSARHPLADRERIGLAELAGTPMASCSPGTEQHEALVQALRGQGVEPDVRYLLDEVPTQLALVAADLAAALVPEMAQRPAPPGVRFVPLESPLRREITAVWRSDSESPPIRACVNALSDRGRPRPAAVSGEDAGQGSPHHRSG